MVLDILLIRPKLVFLKVDLKKPLSRRTQSLTTPKRSGRKVELMRTKSIMNQDNWEIIPINTFFYKKKKILESVNCVSALCSTIPRRLRRVNRVNTT